MQTISTNLLNAVHSQNRRPFASVIVDDPRIRGWVRNNLGSRSIDPFDARLTNNGKIVRAYNVSTANPGILHIALATIGSVPTFSDVSIGTVNVKRYTGVVLYNDPTDNTSPDRVDCYYLDNTSGDIFSMTSANNGTSFSAGASVHGFQDTQQTNARPQLAAAGWVGNGGSYNPYLFYTTASSTNPALGVNLGFYDGSANTNTRCTLGNLGIPIYKTKDPGSTHSPVSGLGAFQANSTDFACVLTINNPRGLSESGIYLIWYRDGIWGQATPIHTYQTPLPGNSSYTISYPSLQVINGVYWVLATETITIPGLSTTGATQSVSHLVAFRSPDAIHWTDVGTIVGTDGIGNGYWNNGHFPSLSPAYDTQFQFNDFVHGRLLVSATRTFLVGYGLLFQLNNGTTSLLSNTAADYATNTLDLTGDASDFSIDAPNGAPSQGEINLQNSDGKYNGSLILRRGSRLIIKGGYKTLSNDSTDLLTNITGIIDEVRQTTEQGSNTFKVTYQDSAMKRMTDWVSDSYLEYSSGRHVWVPTINDYGSTVQVQGQWLLQGSGGALVGQSPDPSLNPTLDMLIANTGRVEDGIFDVKMTIQNTLTGTQGGPMFRFVDNANFYWLVYNRGGAGWQLLQFTNYAVTILQSNTYVTPANVSPAAGQTWWIRTHLYQNQVAFSARQDGTTKWNPIMTNADLVATNVLATNTGYFGFACKSLNLLTQSEANNQTSTGSYEPIGEFLACRFTAPVPVGGGNPTLTSYAVRLDVTGAPGGNVTFQIVPDANGAVPKAVGNAIGAATQTLSISQVITGGWTTITPPSTVTLTAGSHYWIVVEPTLAQQDATHTIKMEYNNSSIEVQSVTDGGTAGSTWIAGLGAAANFLFACTFAGAGGGVALGGYALYSQEAPVTLDYLVREIATKAGVMTMRPNYTIQEAFANLANFDTAGQRGGWTVSGAQALGYNAANTYGFIRYQTVQVGEMVLECDMTLGATAGIAGGFLLNFQNANTLTSDSNLVGYEIEFNVTQNTVLIYALNGTAPSAANRIFSSVPIFDLVANKQYRVKIQHSGKFIMVYLNDALVAAVREDSNPSVDVTPMNPAGYIGLVSYSNDGANDSGHPAVKFDNLTITELKEVKDYFVIEENQSAVTALQNLTKTDRVKFFGDYDGALRYGYFENLQASGDQTYVVIKGTKVSTDRYWASHYRPYGDVHADRYNGALLDSDGTRFRSYDYADARSDRGAYHQGAYPMRQARELTDTYEFTHAANPALQREDKIHIWNGLDGTDDDYIVDSYVIRYVAGSDGIDPVYDMDVVVRKFISATAEGAA